MPQGTQEKERKGSGSGSEQPSGQEGERSTEESSQTTDQGSNGTPSGDQGQPTERQSPFTHPRLKGRSPEEVERLFSTMEATVTEQKRTLDQAYEQMKGRQAAPTNEESPTPSSRPSDKEFWNEPVKTMEHLIKKHLEDTISPFREDLRVSQTSAALNRIRADYPDFDDYKPLVDEMARRAGNTSPSYEELRSYYIYAVGAVSRHPEYKEQLGTGSGGESPPPTRRPDPPPPQNRASSQPLPDNSGGESKRPLTEQEKRLAREFGMTEEQYREYSASDPMEL